MGVNNGWNEWFCTLTNIGIYLNVMIISCFFYKMKILLKWERSLKGKVIQTIDLSVDKSDVELSLVTSINRVY